MTRIFEKVNFAVAAIAFTALIVGSLMVAGNGLVLTEVSAENTGNRVSKKSAVENLGNLPAFFEENRGQMDSRVKYFSRGNASEMFLTATEAVYVVRSKTKPKADETDRVSEVSESNEKAVAVYMRLAGANAAANFAPTEALEHKTNYFRGRDSSKWQTDVPNFGRVTAEHIYDGIDMVWHGKENGALPYDFVVRQFADPNLIELEIEGADEVLIDADGSLVIKTAAGEMRQSKPHTFQESDGGKSEVESGFVLTESDTAQGSKIYTVKFALGEYDNSKTLTLGESDNSSVALGSSDLMYSTFLGGAAVDTGTAIAVDGSGRTFVTGYSRSTDFPTTPGPFDPTQNGNYDAFITKLNADGSGLVYSTFLGGANEDKALDIAIDIAGNAFVTGLAGSSDFPTTAGAFDTTYSGGEFDVFVTKLNASGSGLIYSTFLGGTNHDTGSGIAVDGSGNVFVTGLAGSADFPTTAGAFDTVWNGGSGFVPSDGFITKLNASGSALVYSTFFGGDDLDDGDQIALDSTGNAFVIGDTRSDDFPVTAGAFDTSHNGDNDSFVLKLNPSGSALIYSTFLGGTAADVVSGMAVDGTGNVFVTGSTFSSNFPTTAGAFDTTFNGGGLTPSDGFITKLNASGSGLIYSTFLGGGTGTDSGSDIAIDIAGRAIVLGGTESTDFPTTAGAFDITFNGGEDVFIAKLNASGSALTYSTFFGGTGFEGSPFRGIAIDNADNVYITGRTLSSDFPTTTGAFDTTYSGTEDVFVAKFGSNPLTPVLGVYSPTTLVLSDNIVITPSFAPLNTLRITASSTTNFIGELTADPVTGVVRVTNAAHANIAPGTYPVTVKAFGGGTGTATATFNLTVLNPLPCSSLLFNPPVTHGTDGTFSPVIGDFNGDGNQDIAINNTSGTDNVSILIGDGNGSFAPAVNYPGGSSLTIDDFDGDGNQDIATLKAGQIPSIAILWGNGDGTFAVGSDIPTNAQGSRAVKAGDFNEDGIRDLAVANFTANNVSIVIGLGTRNFAAPVFYFIPFQSQPIELVVGDFNNDGHHDVMTLYNQSRTIVVFNGTGTGTFTASAAIPLGTANSSPRSLVIGDFNLDGNQDVALVANASANSVLILLGNGNSTFAAPVNYAVLSIGGIAIGDFNGDGIQDIAVSRTGTPTVRILQGTSTGTFTLLTSQFPAGGAAGPVAIGDFNGDFRQDIIITTSGGPGIGLLKGTCPGPAANVSVSGRATTLNGVAIRNARLVLTSPDGTRRMAQTSTFGYYAFEEVEVGQTYILEIASKRYTFANPTRVINLQGQMTGVDFIAEPQ